MNILFLAKDSGLGGVVTSTRSLSLGLINQKKAKIVIGICKGIGQETILSDLDVHIIDYNTKNPIGIIKNYLIIKKIINDYKINIIHAQNRIPAIYADLYCRFHNKTKYIWANHLVPIPSSWIYRITTKYGSKAVTDCMEGKSLLKNALKIPDDKIEVINLGMDLSQIIKTSNDDQRELKNRLGILQDEKVIILYGRLTEHKGHLLLLNSISKCSNQQYKLIFPGEDDDYKRKIINLAQKLGIADKLIFPGFIKGNEYLSISDLLVLPSEKESFGMSLIEAFKLEVPVIRSMTGGYEDMADMCFGFKSGDGNELTALLNLFFDNPKVYTEKAKYAYDCVDRFSINNAVDKYYHLYREILNDSLQEE